MTWIWETLLELTTDTSHRKGYIYGSPTIADLDGDGNLEIVIGSATGYVYSLNASNGNLCWKAPIRLEEIREQGGCYLCPLPNIVTATEPLSLP